MPIFSQSPLSPPQATPNLLSVSMDVSILDLSYEWNHTAYALVSPLSLSISFKFFHVEQISVLHSFSQLSNSLLYGYIPFIRSQVDGHVSCFQFLALMKNLL